MFDHVTIRVASRSDAERFYRTTLDAAHLEAPTGGPVYTQWRDFSIAEADERHPVTSGLHLAFSVASRDHVDAFWRAGLDAGAPSDGRPGARDFTSTYYGAFLRDPDGNSVEAVHRDGRRTDGNVDHLWLRVADLRAAQRFYDAVAPYAPFRPGVDSDARVSYVRDGGTSSDRGAGGGSGGAGAGIGVGVGGAGAGGASGPGPGYAEDGGGTFSLVAGGERTTNVHVAFQAPDRATVDAFHAAALAAGYTDHGAPGARPEYGPHYYGAFVLDPDGNHVESVYVGPR